MGEHFRTLSATIPIILQKKDGNVQILLHRRKNTGYKDEEWHMAGSGYVDENETAKMTAVR
ncbi:hypothetical protein [Clostridium intestinale]|uniref:hypothetical protein n=1 Tax=Clostridium intestinale TaxID=36845 RepID=UPI002DD62466|nr:hypothetical protein [Clostridium intestinale]WRY52520.1 hypothetical protein P8F83_04825 [Clostridium intestinale]